MKGLHALARRVLKADSATEEVGTSPFKPGKPGFGRTRSPTNGSDSSGLSPVAAFLLSRFVTFRPSCEHNNNNPSSLRRDHMDTTDSDPALLCSFHRWQVQVTRDLSVRQ